MQFLSLVKSFMNSKGVNIILKVLSQSWRFNATLGICLLISVYKQS